MKKYIISIIISSLIIFAFACDDENTDKTSDGSIYKDALVVTNADDLPGCSSGNEGQLYYLQDSKLFEYCDGTEYQIIDITGEEGPEGEQGPEGPTIKVYDGNDTLLGYSVSTTFFDDDVVILSPNGYLYSIRLNSETPSSFIIWSSNLFFESTNCTGNPYASYDDSSVLLFTGFMLYDLLTDNFYTMTSSEIQNIEIQSYTSTDGCHAMPASTRDVLQVEVLTSRADAGIPESIIPPLRYVLE